MMLHPFLFEYENKENISFNFFLLKHPRSTPHELKLLRRQMKKNVIIEATIMFYKQRKNFHGQTFQENVMLCKKAL